MHFWSEGLGDSELIIGLDRAKIDLKGDCVSLTGVVDSPAPWEYEVKIHFADWEKILTTATCRETCDFVVTHMRVKDLASMAWSILKFLVLLAGYRVARVLHVVTVGSGSVSALDGPGTRKA